MCATVWLLAIFPGLFSFTNLPSLSLSAVVIGAYCERIALAEGEGELEPIEEGEDDDDDDDEKAAEEDLTEENIDLHDRLDLLE